MRNNTIDLFKLIASFSVITVHVGLYADISQTFGEIARLSGRWAVPFFFLVTGAFLAINKREKKCNKQAIKILSIFLVSSLLFLPYVFLKDSEYLNTISVRRILTSGTYFHLWFLSSLAAGLVSFQLINNFIPRMILPFSIFFILIYAVVDVLAYTPEPGMIEKVHGLSRYANSFSFISLGYLIVDKSFLKNTPVNVKEILIVIIFFGLFFLEPFITYKFTGSEVMQRQFPIFTPIIAVIIMILCFRVNTKRNLFSEAGEKYSLGIYLVHPLFLPIFNKLFAYMNVSNTILIVIMTFFSSWMFVVFLKIKIPFAFNLLYGSVRVQRKKLITS